MKSQQDVSTVSTKLDALPQAQLQLPPFGFAFVWVYKSACEDPVRVLSPAGRCVWSAAQVAGVEAPEQCVFLLAGRDVGSSYVLHSGDVVFCRVLPRFTVAALVLSACAIVGGIVAGVAMKKYAEDQIAKALKNATATAASTDSTTSEEYPWLKGAANQVATGRTFPYIVGKTYFSPYKLCAAHMTFTDKTTSDGTWKNANQFYNTVLECGFNYLTVKELRLKNTVLADYNETYLPQGIGDDVAATTQGTLEWKTSCLYYDDENELEIRQDGDFVDLTQFNVKKIWTDVGSEMPHDYEDSTADSDGDGVEDSGNDEDSTWISGITCELPSNVARVECWMELPTCYYYNDSSEKTTATVSMDAYWSNDGGETWNAFDYDSYGYLGTKTVSTTTTSTGTASTSTMVIKTLYQSYAESLTESTIGGYLTEKGISYISIIDWSAKATSGSSSSIGNAFEYYITIYYTYSVTTSATTYSTVAANQISANTTAVQRYCFYQSFKYSQSYGKTITVRLRRTSQKYENDASSVYFLGANTIHYDDEAADEYYEENGDYVMADVEDVLCKPLEDRLADKCTRLGITLKSTDNTSGSLDYFNVIVQGVARVWDGEAWSEAKSETSNLAAWVLEILTSSHHLPSQYSDDEIDLDSFGAWYQWCEQEGFCADGAITEDDKKGDILDTLLSNGFATLYVDEFTGLLAVAYDGLEADEDGEYIDKDAIAVLNSDNIISIESTREYTRKTDGVRVSYVDAASDYSTNTFILMLDGGEYDPESDTLDDLSLSYVTNYEHAFKLAWRQLAEANASPREVTVQVSGEGAYYPLYSVVYLQHAALAVGLGYARIKSLTYSAATGKATQINLVNPVKVPDTSVKYGVLINCQSAGYRGVVAAQVRAYQTLCDTLYIATGSITEDDELVPQEGDALSFGELTTDDDGNTSFDLVSVAMKVTNISPNGAGYTLTLKDYNKSTYEYIDMPEYRSNVTSVGTSGATSSAVEIAKSTASALQEITSTLADSATTEDVAETVAAASEVTADEVAGLVSRGVHYTEVSCVSEDMEEQLAAANIETLRKEIDDVHCDAMAAVELAREDTDALKSGTDAFEKLVCSGKVKFTGLPTEDPCEAGRLWNNNGTLCISV